MRALSSPLFSRVTVHRAGGDLSIAVDRESVDARYIQALDVNGGAYTAPHMPESLALQGGRLHERLSAAQDTPLGTRASAAPQSFPPLD